MTFHRNAAGKTRFGPKVGANAAAPGVKPGKPVSEHEKVHGAPHAPHGGEHSQEKHVKQTYPGKTQPHPVTGVHAHHAHHTGAHGGGGPAYTTHTHHDDGTVETKDNLSHDEMTADREEAFPPENEMAENESMDGQHDEAMEQAIGSGIGGEAA